MCCPLRPNPSLERTSTGRDQVIAHKSTGLTERLYGSLSGHMGMCSLSRLRACWRWHSSAGCGTWRTCSVGRIAYPIR